MMRAGAGSGGEGKALRWPQLALGTFTRFRTDSTLTKIS